MASNFRKFLIDAGRCEGLYGIPFEDVLEDLVLNDTLTSSEEDQINTGSGNEVVKNLFRLFKKKPPSAYVAFVESLKEHRPDLYSKHLEPLEKEYKINQGECRWHIKIYKVWTENWFKRVGVATHLNQFPI